MSNQPIRINVGSSSKYTSPSIVLNTKYTSPSIVVNNVVKPHYVTTAAFQQLVDVVEDIPNKYVQKSEVNSMINQAIADSDIVVYNSDENCLEVL